MDGVSSPLSSAASAGTVDLASQKQEVTRLAVAEGVFSESVVAETVDMLYGSLHVKYFSLFAAQQIAQHVNLLLAARKVAEATKSRTLEFKIEESGGESAFYVCSLDQSTAHRTEQAVSDFLEKRRTLDKAVSVIFMSGKLPLWELGGNGLGFYMVEFSEWSSPKEKLADLADEDDLVEIASKKFLRSKTPAGLHMYQQLITRVMASRSTVCEVVKAGAVSPGEAGYVVEFAVYETGLKNYVKELNEIFRSLNIQPRRFYVESFANGIVTYTVYFDVLPAAAAAAAEQAYPAVLGRLSDTLRFIPHFKQTPGRSALVWELVMAGRIKPEHCIYLLALVKFCFSFFPRESPEYVDLANLLKSDEAALGKLEELHRQAVSERLTAEKIYETFIKHVELTETGFLDFEQIAKGQKKPFWNSGLEQQILELAATTSSLDRKILKTMLHFNANLLLTNFFKQHSAPSAMAFRFKPEILAGRPKVLYPELPFGVYLIMGRGFYGFHVRFRDVARGGIRLIRSRDRATYEKNAASLFDETYNLAYTQQQKNKDIPEGGSKGTILLDSDWATPLSQTQTRNSYFKYIDALLDCMLAREPEAGAAAAGIHSHLEKSEILFFGPDENTGDLSDLGALRGKERGYKFWKALTTGKSTRLGGVPHDVYGMTTHGIHKYVVELFRVLGVDETQVTKFQTGGPDGDLGSNEILVSKDRTVAIVDGSGVAYDPQGLDRGELLRLAKARIPILNFDRKKLGAGGFMVSTEEKDVTLPDGSVWKTGAELRDKFHLLDYAAADLFVPCGGRPQAVNGKNVSKLFRSGTGGKLGECKYKYVVEGANLFFNDDARKVLESAGVHLFKDASANKGGVTSSSLEVFAALAMEEKLHDQMLTVSGNGQVPDFYRAYVKEIKRIIAKNAELEFQAIWTANQVNGMTKVEATKVLSQKINNLADYISSVLDMDSDLAQKILKLAIPSLLVQACGFENILARCPRNYLTAVAAVFVASRYIYRYGIAASEFNFYEFMRRIELGLYSELDEAANAESRAPSEKSGSPTSLPGREPAQAPYKPRGDGLTIAPILL